MELKEKSLSKNSAGEALRAIPRMYFLLLVIGVCALAGIAAWCFGARLRQSITVYGVMIAGHKTEEVYLPKSSYITELCVSKYSYVTEGEVIAKYYPYIKDSTADVPVLHSELCSASIELKSEVSGYVTDILVDEMAYVPQFSCLMRIVPAEADKDPDTVVTLVTSSDLDKMETGSKVYVEVYGTNPDINGYVTGTVVDKDSSVTDTDMLYKYLGDRTEAERLYNDRLENVYPVVIALDVDENGDLIYTKSAPSMYSSYINRGCNCTIILSEKRPIDILFGR